MFIFVDPSVFSKMLRDDLSRWKKGDPEGDRKILLSMWKKHLPKDFPLEDVLPKRRWVSDDGAKQAWSYRKRSKANQAPSILQASPHRSPEEFLPIQACKAFDDFIQEKKNCIVVHVSRRIPDAEILKAVQRVLFSAFPKDKCAFRACARLPVARSKWKMGKAHVQRGIWLELYPSLARFGALKVVQPRKRMRFQCDDGRVFISDVWRITEKKK